jgi:hypothetical protein
LLPKWKKSFLFSFLTHNGIKQGDGLFPLIFDFAVGNPIRKVQLNLEGLELNSLIQMFVYTDDINLLRENINTVQNNAEILLPASKNTDLEEVSNEMKPDRIRT